MDGIADYSFQRQLSTGSNGRFYLAGSPARLGLAGRPVVVKVLSGQSTDKTVRRAARELRAFAAVRSPYVVKVLDAGQQDGVIYYAMEYLPGGNLGEPARPLTRADRLAAVADAARAAHALHESGLAHRDINPFNILLVEGGGRLADLGLAQVLTPGATVTTMGPIASLEFVDPEWLAGGAATRLTDIYSLGATLHRALSGQGLYGDLPVDQPMLAVRAVLTGKPEVSADLDPAVADVVRACTDPDVQQRPRTALAVADLVDGLYLPGR